MENEKTSCLLCGDTDYELSFGGPRICPACDCGEFHDEALAHKRLLGLAAPATTNERKKKCEAPLTFMAE